MQKFFYISFPALIVALVAQQLFSWYYNKTYTKAEIDALFAPVTSKYGIMIVYEIGEGFFSPLENPPIPAGPHRGSKVKPIRHRVLMRYPDILQKAFDKYPVEVIKNNLSRIHLAGEIDQSGFKFGGSYDPFRRIIYLVDNGGNNENDSLRAFHHEFSSLLINSHSFWLNPWTDNHPEDFKYLGDIHDTWTAVNKASKAITDNECYEKGIVTNYGLTNFGNDFSEYSAMIFTHPEKFKKIINQYPRVRGKFLVWLEFYQKIAPIFTEESLLGK
jgi:hypothetical protein